VEPVAFADTVEVVLVDACSVPVERALALDPWAAHSAQYVAEVVQGDNMPNRTAVACTIAVEVAVERQGVEQEDQQSFVGPLVPSFLLSTTCIS
jgi:hypothetical protein